MKRCRKCSEMLPLDRFSLYSAAPDGRQYWCRNCSNKENRERYYQRRKLTRVVPPLTDEQKPVVAALRRAQRAARPEHFKNYARDYWRANPDKRNEQDANKRAKRKSGIGSDKISAQDWRKLSSINGGVCCYCGSHSKVTMDHVVPLCKGGRHKVSNILPVCRPCNSIKTHLDLSEFMDRNHERTRYYREHFARILRARSQAFPQQCRDGLGREGDEKGGLSHHLTASPAACGTVQRVL